MVTVIQDYDSPHTETGSANEIFGICVSGIVLWKCLERDIVHTYARALVCVFVCHMYVYTFHLCT